MQMRMPRVTNTLQEITADYKEAIEDPNIFYTQELLNRNGCVCLDGKEKVTISNLIAEQMLKSNPLQHVRDIKMPSGMTYLIKEHTGEPTTKTKNSNRQEERVAMALFKKKEYPGSDIDCFVNYQAPIYRGHDYKDEHLGKIDLIAISHKNKKIFLMELKKYASKETLLRCAAESYTYYKQIDKARLAEEIKIASVSDYEVCPAILVFKDQRQHMQFKSAIYDKVRKLISTLGIRMFVIDAPMQFVDKEYQKYISQCVITDITDADREE